MLTINVKVPMKRDRGAVVEFRSGSARLATGIAAASASAGIAVRHGNATCDPLRPWGHPPFGTYQLLARGPAPAGSETEYGGQLLVFQPMSGNALGAESFGRLHLLVYAGPAGKGGLLRRTQGGLRLQQDQLNQLLDELKREPEALLEIEELRPPRWWQFWKSLVSTPLLAPETPRFSEPPLDEASLAAQIAGGKRFERRTSPQQDDDRASRDSTSSSGSSSGSTPEYSGRGGEFGGAGASGSWDAPGARSVDSSGRIVAAAAGAALAAGALAASEGANAGSVDTQTSTSY